MRVLQNTQLHAQIVQSFVEDCLLGGHYALGQDDLPENLQKLLRDIDKETAQIFTETLFNPPLVDCLSQTINQRTIYAVRDDRLPTFHTKARALLYLFAKHDHLVTPFGGFVSPAMAETAKLMGKKITFIIDESRLSEDLVDRVSKIGGAHVEFVGVQPPTSTQDELGTESIDTVIKMAEQHAKKYNLFLVPIGANLPILLDILAPYAAAVARLHGPFQEVWTASGSGTLTRSIQRGIQQPSTQFYAVQFVPPKYATLEKAKLIEYPGDFFEPSKIMPPFPSTPTVDAKAWEVMLHHLEQNPPQFQAEKILFWNVAPPLY